MSLALVDVRWGPTYVRSLFGEEFGGCEAYAIGFAGAGYDGEFALEGLGGHVGVLVR